MFGMVWCSRFYSLKVALLEPEQLQLLFCQPSNTENIGIYIV